MKNIRQHVLKPTWQKTKNSYELHFPFEASDLGVTARKRDSKMLHLKSTRIVKIRERNLKKCKRFQNKKRWRTMNKKPIPWCFLPFPLWHLPMLLSIKKTQRWSTLIFFIIIMPSSWSDQQDDKLFWFNYELEIGLEFLSMKLLTVIIWKLTTW